MTPEQRAKKLLEPYRKQTHPEEDPGFDAMEKDIAQEFERLTAENERLRALITIIAERHSRVGDLEYDDVIAAAVSGCQQQEDRK